MKVPTQIINLEAQDSMKCQEEATQVRVEELDESRDESLPDPPAWLTHEGPSISPFSQEQATATHKNMMMKAMIIELPVKSNNESPESKNNQNETKQNLSLCASPAWLTEEKLPKEPKANFSSPLQEHARSARKKMKKQVKKLKPSTEISKVKSRKSVSGREEATQRRLGELLDEPYDGASHPAPAWVTQEDVPKQQSIEYSSFREQVNLVRAYLDRNPKALQSVFKKICKLQKVASKIQYFASNQKDPNSEEIANAEARIEPLVDLVADFRSVVQGHVLNCFDLGQNDPKFLTHAVETLSLINECDSRKAVWTKLGGETINQLRTELSFEEDTMVHLGLAFDDRITQMFAGYVFQSADSDQSPFDAIIGAATNSLVTLVVLQNEIAPCFPQKFDVFNLYKERLEKYMMPQVISLFNGALDKLEVHELLRLTAWTEQYTYQVSQPDGKLEGTFNDDLQYGLKLLMKEYLSRVQEQVKQWFANISGRKPDIFSDNEGHLITNDAEDILHIINMQLLIAKEHLSISNCQNVLIACLDELEVIQGLTRLTLETDWKEFELERLCSIVNDTCRLYDKCETLGIDLSMDLGSTAQKKIDDVAKGYTELALYVSTIVAISIIDDVTVLLLPKIFSPSWEEGADILGATVQTLRDYFSDLKVWLPHYFFSKCVRCCFEKILQIYVEVALQSEEVFIDYMRAARNIENDRLNLSNFCYIEYALEIESSGLRGKAVEKRLDVLKAFSKVLLADNPSDATDACQILFRELGPDTCPAAILALVGMRTNSRGIDVSNWECFVDRWKASFTSAVGEGDRLHYNLLHLLLKKKKQKDMDFGSSALIVNFGVKKAVDSPQSNDRGMKTLLNKLAFPRKLHLRSVGTDSSINGELSFSTVESAIPKQSTLRTAPIDGSAHGELSVSTVESTFIDKPSKSEDKNRFGLALFWD